MHFEITYHVLNFDSDILIIRITLPTFIFRGSDVYDDPQGNKMRREKSDFFEFCDLKIIRWQLCEWETNLFIHWGVRIYVSVFNQVSDLSRR